MSTGMIVLIAILLILILIALYVMNTYNSLVQGRNKVKDQWSQIDVLLKRRADLIPNLVETVKGYATHEKDTLDAVISARAKAVNATNPKEEMKANGELSNALGRLMAVAEAYPDLKANTNFMDLQNQLKDTEDKIANSRQFYNDTVLSYNNSIEVFPANFVASSFHFEKADFFNVTNEADREAPKVQF
jgi:LemA protein